MKFGEANEWPTWTSAGLQLRARDQRHGLPLAPNVARREGPHAHRAADVQPRVCLIERR